MTSFSALLLLGALLPASFPDKGRDATAEKRTLRAGGTKRTYRVQPVRSGGLHPVVVLLHGGTQTARQVWRQTSLPTIASREGFVLAAPEAVGKHWNDGRGATIGGEAPSTADDVGFLKLVIADVVARDGGDKRAVFLVGVSNGGFMTMRFACEAGDLLAGAGNVISDLPLAQSRACPSTKPLPWISMNGTEDPLVPFAGEEEGAMVHGRPQPALLSADATFAFWADRARCGAAAPGERVPHRDSGDPTWAEKRVRPGCAGGAASVQYVFHGAGHTWPNGGFLASLVSVFVGKSNHDVDAGEAIWDVFRRALPAATAAAP